ncbi:MAG: DNA polymerase III subunit delta' [Methylococcales bacterium]
MSYILQTYPWLQSSWFQLNRYINQSRIPQALLIVGNVGLGKQYLAEYFAKSIMCSSPQAEERPCGKCQSCLLFAAHTHPDFFYLAPEEPGKAMGIDIIRQLTVKLALKPQFESYRVVVINSADSLNNASANAFLKYLEEPTARTSLILLTDKPAKLPATIRSRCQKLYVSLTDKNQAIAWLKQQGVVDNVDLLLRLSKDSPLLAKQYADNSVLEFRAENFTKWLKVITAKENFIVVAEQWSKLGKNEMQFLLFCLTGWMMDIIKLKSNSKVDKIANKDLLSDLQQLSERLDLKALYKYYDFLLLSQQRLDTQLNKQLIFEEILIHCSELNRG